MQGTGLRLAAGAVQEAWAVGEGERWDLTKLNECAERHTEWQGMLRELRATAQRMFIDAFELFGGR